MYTVQLRLSNSDADNLYASPSGQILLGTYFLKLFCTIHPEFQYLDPDGQFSTTNLTNVHYKMTQ